MLASRSLFTILVLSLLSEVGPRCITVVHLTVTHAIRQANLSGHSKTAERQGCPESMRHTNQCIASK